MQIHDYRLTIGITRTKEFELKKLATHAVNVGTKCGHGCLYCSSGSLLRMHRSFSDLGLSPFETGYAILDPNTPERVAEAAHRIQKRGMIQLCTTVDAYSPEAQQYDLGRRCLQAILAEPGWTVRILTKNTAVEKDFDLIQRYRDRVLVGMSITATPDNADKMAVVEPNASPNLERIAVMREAHKLGLRTYAMFCPLLPGIADDPGQIDELVRFAVECGAEEIFAEPVNPRGPGLRCTQEALQASGFADEAAAVAEIRRKANWSKYVTRLVAEVQRAVRAQSDIGRLRVLLYPSGLNAADESRIRGCDEGVVWLKK